MHHLPVLRQALPEREDPDQPDIGQLPGGRQADGRQAAERDHHQDPVHKDLLPVQPEPAQAVLRRDRVLRADHPERDP